MLKNRPCMVKNAGFSPMKRGCPKRYTGAPVALRWTYAQPTDTLKPNRHRRRWNLTARPGGSASAE